MFNNLPRKNRGQGKYMMDQKVFLEKSISKLIKWEIRDRKEEKPRARDGTTFDWVLGR